MKKIILGLLCLFVLSGTTASALTDYTDLSQDDAFYNSINYWSGEGVLEGYEDGSFQAEADINRAEFLKIVMGVAGVELSSGDCYPDVNEDDWFSPAVCTATELGYVQGYDDGEFKPGQTINFVEASKIVSNVLELELGEEDEDVWYQHYVEALEIEKAIPNTIAAFSDDISRGEMAEITWRVDQDPSYVESISYGEVTRRERATEYEGEGYTFESCEDLGSYLDDNTRNDDYPYHLIEEDVFMMDSAEESAGAAPSSAAKSSESVDYSETNVQVQGVDEADIVKTDGEYIYYVNNYTVQVMKAYTPEEMELLSELDFEDGNFYPSEIYVDGDKLVVIGYSYADLYSIFEAEKNSDYSYYWETLTKLYVFDISDKSDISIDREVDFEGRYLSSRKVDGNVYLVMNRYSNYYNDFVEETIIPMYGDTKDGKIHKTTGCADVLYFPGETSTDFLVLASVPLDGSDVLTDVVVGSGENVYSTRENLYVATTNYDWYYWDGQDEEETYIYKFDLEDLAYQGKGAVPGYIDNQFSMDEHDGYFRVSTTTGDNWSGSLENHLYVLNSDLKVVGSINGIAPGEMIYATRFMGDRAYLVTFKQIDPFFVIDLSSPTNPEILGYLKIPGYSDYLHPYGENYVIGFGKETAEPTEDDEFWGVVDFVWFQGMKIAMFDVTDTANPIQLHKEIIGDRGTYSELLYNHKALLFDEEKGMMAFPVTVAELAESYKDDGAESANVYGDYVYQGAYVYDVSVEDGFELRGTITHYSEEEIDEMSDTYWWSGNKDVDRILYIGDYFYTISEAMLKATDRDTMVGVNSVSY